MTTGGGVKGLVESILEAARNYRLNVATQQTTPGNKIADSGEDANNVSSSDNSHNRVKERRSTFAKMGKKFSLKDLHVALKAKKTGPSRKLLIRRHRILTDLQLGFALFGMIVTVVNMELLIAEVYYEGVEDFALRLIVTISTLLLIICLISAWVMNIQLRMLEQTHSSWKVSVRWQDVFLLLVEVVVCVIHPLPHKLFTNPAHDQLWSLDGVLSILMMLRLYIFIKFIAAHSELRSQGAYTHFSSISTVKINIAFVFKALMSTKPGLSIVLFITTMFIVTTWAMRMCELFYHIQVHPDNATSFLNAMWVVAMTFLTVGYGDVVPASTCGRFISTITGLMGVASTALLVAILAKKLEQNQTEKCVHSFVKRIQIEHMRRRYAANIITLYMKIWLRRYRHDTSRSSTKTLLSKIGRNVAQMKNCKQQLAMLAETRIELSDIDYSLNRLTEQMDKVSRRQMTVEDTLGNISDKIDAMGAKVDDIIQTQKYYQH